MGGGIDSRGYVSDSLAKAKDIFRVQFWRAEDGGCWARIDSATVGARVGPGGLPQRLSWRQVVLSGLRTERGCQWLLSPA